MGSTTYEWILRHADKVVEETGSRWPYAPPAWVYTHRKLPTVERADIRFVQGSIRKVHAEMTEAAGGKNICHLTHRTSGHLTSAAGAAISRTMMLSPRQDQDHAYVTEACYSGRGKASVKEKRRGELQAIPSLPPLAGAASEDT